MINQSKNNNLNYLVDPTFSKAYRLSVFSFRNENENDRSSFSKYYTPEVEIKDLNVLIDCIPINKQKNIGKQIKISKNNDNATGNLLNY